MSTVVDEEHFRALRGTFEIFDSDCDGIISAFDLRVTMHMLGHSVTASQAKRMLNQMRKVGDCVYFDDFLESMLKFQRRNDDNEQELRKAFRAVLGKIDSGGVSAEELSKCLKWLGVELFPEDIKNFSCTVGVNDRVDFEAFKVLTQCLNTLQVLSLDSLLPKDAPSIFSLAEDVRRSTTQQTS